MLKELGLKWAKLNDEEKKSYFDMHVEQKQAYMDWKSQGKVKPEVNKEVSSRCSLKKLSLLFKEMQMLKIDCLVTEIGFGPLLGLKSRAIHRDICCELVQNFDLDIATMESNGHKIPIMVEHVEAVLGLKNKGVDIGNVIRKMNGKELALKHKINTKTTYHQLYGEIVSGASEGDELKARVLIYIVGVFLCPNMNTVPSIEHLKLLYSVGLKGKLNWCKWAYERLINGVSKFKYHVDNAYITECIAILEVMGSDDDSAGGTNVAKMNASTDIIMDAFEVFSPLNEMKVTLETGVERQNKIEESLETLKDESKHVVDKFVGLSANMIFSNDAIHLNNDQVREAKVVMDAPTKVSSKGKPLRMRTRNMK
ncbi:hypothetical protein GQ457_07G010290 [Hibiscus cannabinus]